jgi:hypothetical protein
MARWEVFGNGRTLQDNLSGAIYHFISRGNGCKPVSRSNRDRLTFIDDVENATQRPNGMGHAFCLLTGHDHRRPEPRQRPVCAETNLGAVFDGNAD